MLVVQADGSRGFFDRRVPARRGRTTARGPLNASVASCAALLFGASSAAAAQPACADPGVSVEGSLSPDWADALAATCASLGSLGDVDPAARLVVVPAGEGVIVEVALRDGRRTLRRVRHPEDLSLTIAALMTVPVAPERPAPPATEPPAIEPSAPPSSSSPTSDPPSSNPRRGALGDASSDRAGSSSTEPIGSSVSHDRSTSSGAPLGFRLGATLVGRVSGPGAYLSLGPAAHLALTVGPWAFGISGRWDAYEQVVPGYYRGFEMDGFGASLFVSRAIVHTSAVHLDVGFAGGFLEEGQTFVRIDSEEGQGSKLDARLGPLARAGFGAGSTRWLVTLETELSPIRLRRAARIDPALPKLPAFSSGIGTGVEWSVP